MTIEGLIDKYVTAHANCRWMDAGELRVLLSTFVYELTDIQENRGAPVGTFSSDVDEVAYKYSFESRPSVYGQVDVIDAFKAGAEWQKEHDAELIEIAYNDGITIGMTKQKEQMLKDAVEGVVGEDGILALSNGETVDLSPSLDKIAFGLQPSQKVRILVLKEEEDLE